MPRQEKPVSLRKRSQFQATAAFGKKWVTPAFILQTAPRPEILCATESPCGFGLTASKKMIGIAVLRNRARRRLRALAAEVLPLHATEGLNFVFIARSPVLSRSYEDLRKDLVWALKRLDIAKREAP